MARNQASLLIGIVLLAAGIAAAAYGVYTYQNLQNSVGNTINKFLSGRTEGETEAFIYMAAGGISAILGVVLLVQKKKRRRRR